jgi:predicted N-acyltransferase
MEFDVQIVHSVEEIGQEAWDRLAGNRPFASYRWYRFGERVLADNVPIYIILSRWGEPLARGTFWLRWREQLPISSRIARYFAGILLRRRPLLMCRTPLVDASGLILPEEPSLRDAILRTVTQAAQGQAQAHRVSFLIFDYLGSDDAEHIGGIYDFAVGTFSDPGTYLAIAWPDFDSYLSQLSRKTRKHYRQNCRLAEELGLEIVVRPAVGDVERAMDLIGNVERRHRSSPYPWTRELLENAGMVDAVWIAAELSGRLVGGELVMGDAGVYCVKALGLDYTVPHVYFLLGYADIQYAIERRARRMRWGSGAHDVKRRLGFQLEDNNHLAFTGGSRLFQALSRWGARSEWSN